MNKAEIKKINYFIKRDKNINQIDSEIKKYWMRHPFTPGHGYTHSLNVAKNAYNLARKNNYENPDIAFAAGLLHDITRPIKNKDGEEKHAEYNGKIAEKILLKIKLNKQQIKEIKQAIIDHERLFKKNKSSLLSIILYLADKTDMNMERCLVYGFISNFNSFKKIKKQPYNKLNKAIKDFNKKLLGDKKTLLYIQKELPKINGTETVLVKYNMAIKNFANLLKKERNNYQRCAKIANQLTKRDILENQKFFKIINTVPKQAEKIMKPLLELLPYLSTKPILKELP